MMVMTIYGWKAGKTTEEIYQAFAKDGFISPTLETFEGKRGIVVRSANTTLFSDKSHKPAYYVEGTSYQQGYLMGLIATEETNAMCTTYIEHELADLIDEDFDEKHKDEAWYEVLLSLLRDLIVNGAIHSFENDAASFPQHLLDEMKGLVDGVKSKLGSKSGVTFERLVTLNYGIDFLLAHVYAGKLKVALDAYLQTQKRIVVSTAIRQRIDQAFAEERFIKEPVMCDSFTTKNHLNRDPSKIYFARDFQQPNGMIFQKVAGMIVHVPEDNGIPFVGVGAPGMVGAITALNAKGVAIGVDIIRSALVNPEHPGVNSIFLVRHIGQFATSTRDAIQRVASLKRGCSWLYPISDATGDSVIIESGRYEEHQTNPLDVVTNKVVKSILPNEDTLKTYPSPWLKGIYYRDFNFTQPQVILGYNRNLFSLAQVDYPEQGWGNLDFTFTTYTQENMKTASLLNNWFPAQRQWSHDYIICANHALTPQMRVAQMSNMANFITRTQHASSYRYDSLNKLIFDHKGTIDLEKAKYIISFLAPDRTPGYFHHYYDPTNVMTAAVEGAITVCELTERVMATKTGYFIDDWTQISLMNYLS